MEHQEKIGQFKKEYDTLKPKAVQLERELTHQLDKILGDAEISLGVPMQSRIKTWDSLAKKLNDPADRFKNVKSIGTIQDIVGFRVILLFARDVEKACTLIRNHLTIHREYDPKDKLKDDQFGYASIHFVVKLPDSWLATPSCKGLEDILAEIQIRTVAQHTWAAASHVLQYKNEGNIPRELRRAIHRVSAMLELVDLEFERVLAERDAYRTAADVSNVDDMLNVDLLAETMDMFLPEGNRIQGEEYSDLLRELKRFGIDTLSGLRELITNYLEKVLDDDASEVEKVRDSIAHEEYILGVSMQRIEKGAFYSHTGLVERMLFYAYPEKYAKLKTRSLDF